MLTRRSWPSQRVIQSSGSQRSATIRQERSLGRSQIVEHRSVECKIAELVAERQLESWREPWPSRSPERQTFQPNISFNSPPGYPLAKSVKVPELAISFAAFINPAQAFRTSEPPTLMRRTPGSFACVSDISKKPINKLTGLGCTAFTTAAICSFVLMPGA